MPCEGLSRLACCGARSVFRAATDWEVASRRKLLPLNRLRTDSIASFRRPLAKLFSVSAPVSRVPAQLTAACSGGFGNPLNASSVPKSLIPLLRSWSSKCAAPKLRLEWGNEASRAHHICHRLRFNPSSLLFHCRRLEEETAVSPGAGTRTGRNSGIFSTRPDYRSPSSCTARLAGGSVVLRFGPSEL
jgi:hypothetical protein